MGKMTQVFTFIYGGILVLFALVGFGIKISWISLVAEESLLPFIVGGLGVIIMLTPLTTSVGISKFGVGGAVGSQRPRFVFIRRWVFGVVVFLIGFGDILLKILPFSLAEAILSPIKLGTIGGSFVMLVIGAVYIIAAFPQTRHMNVSSY